MKICSKCKKEKEEKEFNKHESSADKLSAHCKICIRESARKYYLKNSEKVKLSVRKSKQKLHSWYSDFKSTLRCKKCGENHISCLEFHHLDPSEKEFGVSNLVKLNKTKEEVLNEIDKCIVLCSNCHRKLHWKEKTKSGNN